MEAEQGHPDMLVKVYNRRMEAHKRRRVKEQDHTHRHSEIRTQTCHRNNKDSGHTNAETPIMKK